jgi:hypothetical protein
MPFGLTLFGRNNYEIYHMVIASGLIGRDEFGNNVSES